MGLRGKPGHMGQSQHGHGHGGAQGCGERGVPCAQPRVLPAQGRPEAALSFPVRRRRGPVPSPLQQRGGVRTQRAPCSGSTAAAPPSILPSAALDPGASSLKHPLPLGNGLFPLPRAQPGLGGMLGSAGTWKTAAGAP